MRGIKKWIFTLTAACLFLMPSLTAMAKGGPIVIVADTRRLTGIAHWWASIYNDSHLEFALLTCILIPIIGVTFGLIADFIMNRIGIDLKKRSVAEH